MVVRGVVVMALSASGKTEEILRLLATLKRLQVPLISLTGDAVFEKAAGGSPATTHTTQISTLAAAADVALDCSVAKEACGLGLAPTASTTAMVIVNQKFLYLPQSDSRSIQAFTIDHTSGALTAISGSPFATAGADSITSDPAGRFLFVGNQTTGSVSVFQINATTGALVAAPASPFSAFNLDFAKFLAVDGSGTFLYVGQGSPFLPIYAFSIDQSNGALSTVAGSPFGLNVALVRTDFTGKHAIGISGTTGDNHLYVFAINPTTGALTAVSNSPFATTMATPQNLRVHPSSQFVYAFGVDSSSASAATEGFAIDPTSGALTPLAGSPFTGLPMVDDCKWDQGGGEAFCADAATSAFSVLNTSTSTGALTHTVPDLTVTDNMVFVPTN